VAGTSRAYSAAVNGFPLPVFGFRLAADNAKRTNRKPKTENDKLLTARHRRAQRKIRLLEI